MAATESEAPVVRASARYLRTSPRKVRLVADQDPHHVFDRLAQHVHERAPEVEVVRIGSMEPSRTPLDHPAVARVAAAVADAHDGHRR